MAGWIKLHRSIVDHWIFKDAERFRAWTLILMTVNHKDKKVLVDGELIDCKIGQSLHSLSSWSKIFGREWTIQKTRTFFKLLKNDKIINTEGLRKTTRVTVVNYSTYQNNQQTDNRQTNKQITGRQQTDNNKQELKELKKGKKKEKNTYSSEYESFWKAYLRKGSKKDGFTFWKKLTEEEKIEALDYIPTYIKNNDKQYMKDAERFLKSKLWEGKESGEEEDGFIDRFIKEG